jgi:hypothetical protein
MTEPAVRPQPSRGGDGFERWRRRLIRVAQYVNPVGGNPTAAVEAMAALDSFGPS